MTATLESTRAVSANGATAPYNAGVLLCEILEGVEMLENHEMGDNGFRDTGLAIQVIANLASRIRKQALAEGLVTALGGGDDGTCGRLSIGEALMDADGSVYRDMIRDGILSTGGTRPTYTRAELADAVRDARHQLGADLKSDLGEKLDLVQHVFEVTTYVYPKMERVP